MEKSHPFEKGFACGSNRFIKKLEYKIRKVLQYRPLGGPGKLDVE